MNRKRVVAACDSFKGCLGSAEIAAHIAAGIRSVSTDIEVVEVAVGDGGEGTADALVSSLGGSWHEVVVTGPLMSRIKARYGISANGETAVMEMSCASGLTLVSEPERNPWLTTTFGTGEIIADAIRKGCRRVLIGIGGSATNDGGLGMLTALGYRFYDRSGQLIEIGAGKDLERVARIDDSGVSQSVKETKFIVACDVDNPFCGRTGAAYVFGRQKGGDEEMIERLDNGMRNFAEVIVGSGRKDIIEIKGAGAAGGLGGAFLAFLDAELKPGIEMVLDAIGFDDLLSGADLVITGEGRIDGQTEFGKTPEGVRRRGVKAGVPVVAVCGSVDTPSIKDENGFLAILPIQSGPVSLQEAMRPENAGVNIERTVAQIVRLYFGKNGNTNSI